MNKIIFLLNITGLLIGISYGLHNPIVPIFSKNEIGASYGELGLIGLANFFPYMFIPVLVGMLLHRYNSGVLLCVGIGLNTVSVFFLSLAKTVPEVMILRGLTGVAHAFFWPPSEAIISGVSEGNTRVKNIARFTGFFVAGFMIGPLAGTFILEGLDVSYRGLFEIATFVMASSIIFGLQLTKKQIQRENGSFSFSAIKQVIKFPLVIMILIYCASSFGMILTIYPAFLNDRSMSAIDIELLYFVFGASRVLTLALADRLVRHTGITLVTSIITISIGLAISFVSFSMQEFIAAMLLMGFGFSIIFPLTLEIILRKTSKQSQVIIIGAYETTFGIGWSIGPIAAGLIAEYAGNSMPYLIFFAIGIGISLISLIKKKMLEPQSI